MRVSCCNSMTFDWIKPYIQHARYHNQLDPDHLDCIELNEGVDDYLTRLRQVWTMHAEEDDEIRNENALYLSVVRAFWPNYIKLMLASIISALLQISGPFLIKKLIDFVKTGKSAFNWEPVSSFAQETEYGLLLVLALVLSQGITYFVQEHTSYQKMVTSTQISHALIALVCEKILKLSPATNR